MCYNNNNNNNKNGLMVDAFPESSTLLDHRQDLKLTLSPHSKPPLQLSINYIIYSISLITF